MPLGIGPWELLVILFIILLLFGAKRVPEVGRSLGRGCGSSRKASRTPSGTTSRTDATAGRRRRPRRRARLDPPADVELARRGRRRRASRSSGRDRDDVGLWALVTRRHRRRRRSAPYGRPAVDYPSTREPGCNLHEDFAVPEDPELATPTLSVAASQLRPTLRPLSARGLQVRRGGRSLGVARRGVAAKISLDCALVFPAAS